MLGAVRCCRAAEPQRRGWGLSGVQEGPPRSWSGARSVPPAGTQPHSLEGCVLTPAFISVSCALKNVPFMQCVYTILIH